MVHATYQKRLSALILGIRPTAGHVYGSKERTPADNLTMLGIQAWRMGLRQLHTDLLASGEPTAGDQWIQDWVTAEIDRDLHRWSDASTMLELLAVALGPASADPGHGPRGQRFWAQWQANITHLTELVGIGATTSTPDTAELIDHCVELVEAHHGPASIIEALTTISATLGPVDHRLAAFRPLTSAVERLQLSAILAAAYDDEPVCTAAMAVLLEQRPATSECRADSAARRRLRGWRYGASVGR